MPTVQKRKKTSRKKKLGDGKLRLWRCPPSPTSIRTFPRWRLGCGMRPAPSVREVAKQNPELLGVLDIKDYNERQSGRRTLDDDRLAALIDVISRHRLGLKNAEPDNRPELS